MKLFALSFNGDREYVEARTMADAIEIWRTHMVAAHGLVPDQEPEDCMLVHDAPVVRSESTADEFKFRIEGFKGSARGES